MKQDRSFYYIFQAGYSFILIAFIRGLGLEWGGHFAAWLARNLSPLSNRNQIVRKNINRAFPQMSAGQVRHMMRDSTSNIGRTISEYANLDRLWAERDKRIELINVDRPQKCAAQGRGLILFSAHIANWEVMLMAVNLLGLDTLSVYRPSNNPWLNKWLTRQHARNGAPAQVPRDAQGTKLLVKKLREGGVVCILTDQKVKTGITANFFNQPAMTTTSPARMASRYDVPLMLTECVRLPGCRFRVSFHEAFDAIKADNQETSIALTTQKMNDALEAMIKRNPEQWFWQHKRWDDRGRKKSRQSAKSKSA